MANGVKKINEFIVKDGRTLVVNTDIAAPKLPDGSLKVLANGNIFYINADNNLRKVWKKFDPNIIFEAESIRENIIANNTISGIKFKDGSITTQKIENEAITTAKIANEAITSPKLINLCVTTEKYANLSITKEKIANGNISTEKLIDECITSDKIKPLNILNSHIAEGTLTNSKISNHTIENSKLKNYTILGGEFNIINQVSVPGSIANKTITDWNLADNAVVERVISNNSISTNKIKDFSIFGNKIKDSGIESRHIHSLNGSKIIENSIEGISLKNYSIENTKLKDNCVSFSKLDNNTQDLINNSLRVVPVQTVFNTEVRNTARLKGNLLIRSDDEQANLSLSLYGNATITGDLTASRCYNPVFADIAEAYFSDDKLSAGDAVCLCKEGGLKIEKLNEHNGNMFLGFISDEYAFCFGANSEELKKQKKYAVTLTGRINIKLKNIETKVGQFLSIKNNQLVVSDKREIDSIGRILENKSIDKEYVLCQLWA